MKIPFEILLEYNSEPRGTVKIQWAWKRLCGPMVLARKWRWKIQGKEKRSEEQAEVKGAEITWRKPQQVLEQFHVVLMKVIP